eukprot:Pgem_evm1s13181
MTSFIMKAVKLLALGEENTHLAITEFNTEYTNHLLLNTKESYDMDAINNIVDGMKYTSSPEALTHLGITLENVRQTVLPGSLRAQTDDRTGQTIVILTDGIFLDEDDPSDVKQRKAVLEANRLRKEGVNIFTVGIGSKIEDKWLDILSPGQNMKVSNFAGLADSVSKIIKQFCDTDCVVADWTPWGTCVAECDAADMKTGEVSGNRTRNRLVKVQPRDRGKPCPNLTETEICDTKCDIDCVISNITEPECNPGCNATVQGPIKWTETVMAEILQPALNNGKACPDLSKEFTCTHKCPIDCVLDDFVDLNCDAKCEPQNPIAFGNITSVSTIATPAQYDGKECGDLTKQRPCNITCPVNCEQEDWVVVEECTADCSTGELDAHGVVTGTYTEARKTLVEPLNGGKQCGDPNRTLACEKPCPVPCKVSNWTATDCTAQCNFKDAFVNGTITSTRTITQEPLNNGTICPTLEKEDDCRIPCDLDCDQTDWFQSKSCDASCELSKNNLTADGKALGFITFHRNTTREPVHNGEPCKNDERKEACDTPCNRDCEQTKWDLGKCTAKCEVGGTAPFANGTITNTRETTVEALYDGTPCGPTENVTDCSIPCDVDCQVTQFEPIGICTHECVNETSAIVKGFKKLQRNITQPQINNGKPCPALDDQEECPYTCPVCTFKIQNICLNDQTACDGKDKGHLVGGDSHQYHMISSEHELTCEIDTSLGTKEKPLLKKDGCEKTCGELFASLYKN